MISCRVDAELMFYFWVFWIAAYQPIKIKSFPVFRLFDKLFLKGGLDNVKKQKPLNGIAEHHFSDKGRHQGKNQHKNSLSGFPKAEKLVSVKLLSTKLVKSFNPGVSTRNSIRSTPNNEAPDFVPPALTVITKGSRSNPRWGNVSADWRDFWGMCKPSTARGTSGSAKDGRHLVSNFLLAYSWENHGLARW